MIYDVIIVGSGPIGLSAAIAAKHHDLDYLVVEKGVLANTVFHYPTNMVYFSNTEEISIGGIPFPNANYRPTRVEALHYYRHVAEHYDLNIRYDTTVSDIQRNKHVLQIKHQHGTIEAKAVIMATGLFDYHNPLNVPGDNLPQVSHYYTEGHVYYKKKVVIVGASNSAVDAALDISRHGGKVTLVHRGEWFDDMVKPWILPEIEKAVAMGDINAFFNSKLENIESDTVSIRTSKGDIQTIENDNVLAMIGYRPDVELLLRIGIYVDQETFTPEHDPNTLETNVRDVYIAGALTVGKNANTIFIFNGRHHGEKIVKAMMFKRSSQQDA